MGFQTCRTAAEECRYKNAKKCPNTRRYLATNQSRYNQKWLSKGWNFPFNANIIPVHKYDPDTYNRYKKPVPNPKSQPVNTKSLKDLCINLINGGLSTNNDCLQKSNITFLSQISKSDIQTLRFVAKQPTRLPICLQNPQPISNQTHNSTKTNIISNVIIEKTSQLPFQTQNNPNQHCHSKIWYYVKYIRTKKIPFQQNRNVWLKALRS